MAEKGGYKHFMLKEIYEQPRAIADTIAGRILDEHGDVFLDGLDLADGAASGAREGLHRRLRHLLACRPGRQVPDREAGPASGGGRYRQRVPLPRPDRHRPHPDRAHQPERRDRRHPGGPARGPGQGGTDCGHLQRGRILHRPGERRRHLHPRRPGDRGRLDQGLHHPAGGALPARPASGPGAGNARRGELPQPDPEPSHPAAQGGGGARTGWRRSRRWPAAS